MFNPLMNIKLDKAERDRMMKDTKVFVDSVNALEEQSLIEREKKVWGKVNDKLFNHKRGRI